MPDGIKLLTGNANRPLAAKVSRHIGIPLTDTTVTRFSDGEIMVQINENIRGADVFVIQPTCTPVNQNIMELLLIIDALKRASAQRITAVIPYYGYARQDRKVQPRVPISSKLIADLLTAAGTNRVLTIDLHAAQIQGFFNIPVDHLYAAPVLLDYIKRSKFKDLVIVSPDAGGVERARAFAKRVDASLAIVDKRREAANISKVMHVIGDVKGKDVIILDDMMDTAGTTTQAALALKDNGAERVFAACSHAVLSGPAIERINNSVLEEVIVTDTIPMDDKMSVCGKLKVQSVAPLLSEAIKRINEETSVSSLFV
ncbi:MAG: phosphoribosylpyrophosphate synthetase [Nitrospirae bacterium GWC2_46_6]|nr:MAG: phosphoribosylpyrophosphate synthetase [Nitrospirae bacterium GWC2_46_6]OGW22287.1 MAG: phosphoribosylpyrophosphate synthetase [Nitrospirae bacterium GWA2_46_11]OGW23180.1 MAG: phosphoribosylpyrophosphate synthetase [Nitrospirae bacterium GWB2_47_37]HAK87730.1 phosphoribosylpyrophosphate synthetase [Nitrospiraceae bacterium]HCZ11452.1 phosphoribosylpyrophosphate synthetase [Nitrospiraceae bacterium]